MPSHFAIINPLQLTVSMRIAVLSDSHDNMENIAAAIDMIKEQGISQCIHLGDFSSPAAVLHFAKSDLQWTCVWGNIYEDKELTRTLIAPFKNIDIAEEDFRELKIDDKKLLITHFPDIARMAAHSGKYDAAFHGHTHMAAQEMVGHTLLANPGEACGYRYGKASFGVYDTEGCTFEHLAI